MSKSNMCLNVEFLAGTSLEDALTEARSKAVQFNLAYVCFDFNGCSFSVRASGNILDALEEYNSCKMKHIIC